MKELVQEFPIFYHEASTLDVAVASAILRGGMQNHICAEQQGPLEQRAGEGIVHNELGTGLVSNIGDTLMSKTFMRGFDGVSIHTSFVLRRIAVLSTCKS